MNHSLGEFLPLRAVEPDIAEKILKRSLKRLVMWEANNYIVVMDIETDWLTSDIASLLLLSLCIK